MATMQLKTYRAASMADALAEVKKDLGRDAVILHTRTFRAGGVMGVGARSVVEITASSGAASPAPRAGGASAALPARAEPQDDPLGFVEFRPPRLDAPRPDASRPDATRPDALRKAPTPPAEPAREATAPMRARPPEPVTERRSTSAIERPASRSAPVAQASPAVPSRPALATPVRLSPQDAGARAALEDELASIKTLVGEVLRVTRVAQRRAAIDEPLRDPFTSAGQSWAADAAREGTGDATSFPRVLMRSYLRLIDAGVDEPIAESLASSVRDELSPTELSDASIVHASMLRAIERRLPTVGGVSPSATRANAPRVIALIGPTGVGKTTTLAKLAATFKLRHARSVGLITCDTYRIAAVEQLRTYAGIIGLPLRVAMTPGEMRDAMGHMSDRDVVLVDTPGRSPGDATRLAELRAFIEASGASEIHLALSTAAAPAALARAIDRFRDLGAHALILTKLDEAGASGPILNIASRAGLPLSYVTMGQEVPDDIEPADAARLARRMLEPDGFADAPPARTDAFTPPGVVRAPAALAGAEAW
ncbi:MAG: flagellar biosynthesis protein FlhF [Phycisphaerales bacterium]|jgi:flagellar biosynthesis protein FlhF|nr:flagellar biosynthesis protein FlhF [Phycisphaerales bacterium]